MPRPKLKARRRQDWPESVRNYLESGSDLSWPDEPPLADVDLESAWEDLAEELLAASPPGTRPHGFWQFDAPEPRRMVKVRRRHNAYMAKQTGQTHYVSEEPEPERDYLARLGLLSAKEQAALDKLDAEDEQVKSLLKSGGNSEDVAKQTGVDIHRAPGWTGG